MPKVNIEDYTGDNYNPDAKEPIRRRDKSTGRKATISNARKTYEQTQRDLEEQRALARKNKQYF